MKKHNREYNLYISETLTDALLEGIEAATIAEAEHIRRANEMMESLWDYLHELEAAEDWDTYSDVYKDLFGVRPH